MAQLLTEFAGVKLRASERALMNRAWKVAEITLSELIRRAAVARAKRILRDEAATSVLEPSPQK